MADDNAIPIRIGHYEIVKTIGKGNFAVVKLARHTITNSKVAIKVISTRTLDSDQLRKLKREIDIMKHVGLHKNILRLYQVMQSDRHVMLVTEFCGGGEIFDQLVAHGRMSEPSARIYFHQIVDAVIYLHSNGIVHRDLKAENLLLTADYKCVKLADFGFSNYYSNDNFLATWCGSPPYAAPELFEGKQYHGPKADIWSLGVVLYVLVCGALPFDGNTLQSLKSRVLSGKFRIPYFMSCDCEHLIRHMLITDPDKRYTLPQIKQHRWMREGDKSQQSSEKLSDKLKNCHISGGGDSPKLSTTDDIDSSIVDWIASEVNVEPSVVMESVKSHLYDQYYALYHLANDSSHCSSLSAPPSPPLLPIIPSVNQRKSSITTGVVEREQAPSNLTPNVTNLRRHTFGPNIGNSNSQNQLVTPPLLFLTPPIIATSIAPQIANLPFAPPNYPLANMDLLRPPPVLLMVNNNMGRRASDGQANYARSHDSSQPPITSASTYNFPTKGSTPHQSSPPISYIKRKRHSLTDTNEIASRQRRSGLANIGLSSSSERCRRRASDGCNTGSYHQHISIPILQSELRALCVSSPPSLHASPVHTSSLASQGAAAAAAAAAAAHMARESSVASLPPSSPPPALPLISEENSTSFPTPTPTAAAPPTKPLTTVTDSTKCSAVPLQKTLMSGLMKAYSASPVPLIAPPHSFRSSPVTSPNAAAPSIAITDELGTMQFPILPPPTDFQLVSSHPNLENDPEKSPVTADILFNKLHRWRNDENSVTDTDGFELTTNFPSHPNLTHRSETSPAPAPSKDLESCIELNSFHYSSLQCIRCNSATRLTTTDSGSIYIKDPNTASKVLSRFGHEKDYEKHILKIDESNLQISIEWNELQQQVILRHVSGDASRYKNLCHELISTII